MRVTYRPAEGIRQFIDEQSFKPGLGTCDISRKGK
jgi:hypothetical protein